jgi:hypothetical protein
MQYIASSLSWLLNTYDNPAEVSEVQGFYRCSVPSMNSRCAAVVVQVPNLLVPDIVFGLCQTTKRYVLLLSVPYVYCKIYLWNTAQSAHTNITLYRHAGTDHKFWNYVPVS